MSGVLFSGYSTLDPLDYGRHCGYVNRSYLPNTTWRTPQDYIDFACGWREGRAQRLREEATVLAAQDAAAGAEWRRSLEAGRAAGAGEAAKRKRHHA